MSGQSKSNRGRRGRGVSRWVHFGILPALLLATAPGSRSDAASAPAPPTPASSPAVSSATPAAGAAPAGWLDSAQLDLEQQEYELSWQASPVVDDVDASWHAPNRSQGFRTYFTSRGIRVVPRTEPTPSWRWGLSLVGYGRGAMTWVVPQATLTPSGHRIDYHRGSLDERYENTPGGLEQVFTLPAPPGHGGRDEGETGARGWTTALRRPAGMGPASEPNPHADPGGEEPSGSRDWIHLDFALWGDLSPRVSEDGQTIDFVTPSGAPVLRYAHLKVTDARGATLPSWMEGFSGMNMRGIRLVVDARQAVYPITVDPLATSATWTAESDQANASFGVSVATAGDVNGDGYSDVIVGAHQYDGGLAGEGRAYVFLGSASGLAATPAWTAKGNQAGASFGKSASTAGDVNGDGYADVIVGADFYDTAQTNAGRVFVYLGSASGLATTPAWTADGDQSEGLFGSGLGGSVATAGDINGDGYADVIVGSLQYSNGQSNEGRAYVYLGSASGLAATPVWTGESNQASALFGTSVATAGDVNGDGYSDVIVGAPNYSNGQTNEGRAFVYLGSASGPAATPAWTAESNQASAVFGRAVATAGDVNGDGYADVIIGADLYDNGQTDEGRAFLYLGSASGLAASPAWTAESDQAFAGFGRAVATAGDVNGDGYADVIVGANSYDNGESNEGRAFVYLGNVMGSLTSSWTAESNQADAEFGFAVGTAGDVNGDGYADVIVGADLYDNGQTDEGRTFVYHGSASALVPELSLQTSLPLDTPQPGASFGTSVSTAGDVNGDGYADVIVGAPNYYNGQTDEGQAYVYLGPFDGSSPAWIVESDQAGAKFGTSVASAGDVNGDGYADVIVGAPFYANGQAGEGRAYVYLGAVSGLATTPAWMVESDRAGANLGASVASAGDVNGDGYADVIVGAPFYANGQTGEGRAYLYLGSASGLGTTPAWTSESDQADAQFGHAVAPAGDVNRDGYSDVIVSATHYDNGSTDEGRVYVYLGSPQGLALSPAWTVEANIINGHFGRSVSTAGDVNGDGYSDIIIGADSYQFGETNLGRAFIYLGSASGLAPTFSWEARGTQNACQFGAAVATAGDVNGDGYSDILVGAPLQDILDVTDHGQAFLWLGSASGPVSLSPPAWSSGYYAYSTLSSVGSAVAPAGDVDGDGFSDYLVGAPGWDEIDVNAGGAFFYSGTGGVLTDRIPRQTRSDATAPIALLGKSDSETALYLKLRGRTAAGRGKVRLQWEVKPLGTAFNGTGIGSSAPQGTGAPDPFGPYYGSATELSQVVTGLAEGTFYHWRARAAGSDPFFPHSPWVSVSGNNVTETKVRTAGCLDRDGDGYGALGDPSCLSPTPDCNDASASAWGTPGETLNLRFTSDTTLLWDPPAAPGAPTSALLYDTLRSLSPGDFLSASCLESNDGPNTTTTDGTIPTVGQVLFYLTRAQDACPQGAGTLGTNSSGAPRAGVNCP